MSQGRCSLIGSDFKGMSDLSAFGRLYRISRLNSLTARQAIDIMGVDKHVRGYLERHAAFPWPGWGAWDQMTIPRRAEPTKVNDLVPYLLDRTVDINEQIRGCRTCLRAGFHSLLHQLPWIDLCPWHREPLVERCECGRRLLEGARDTQKLLLLCRCGHDFYDRLDALASTTSWRPGRSKGFVAKQIKIARSSRARHRLETDLFLSVDQAIAAALGKFIPARYILMTDVIVDQIDDDREAQCRAITDWNPFVSFPSYPRERLIHLLQAERLHLKEYLRNLHLRTPKSTDEYSWRAFHGQGSQLIFHRTPVDSIEGIDSTWTSQRDHDLVTKVVARFVQRHSTSRTDTHVNHNDHLQTILDDPKIDLRDLAGTLSAISMQAFMEQALHAVWSAYARERLPLNLRKYHPGAIEFAPGVRFGHPIAVLSPGEPLASRVVRVLGAPDFIDLPEILSGDYARPTQKQRRDRSTFYWG